MTMSSRSMLAKIAPLKAAYGSARRRLTARLAEMSPVLLSRLRYREAWGRWPDLINPATFDEKLLWLKSVLAASAEG